MANIVRLRAAQPAARTMDNAVLAAKDCGNADATMDGMEPIVPLHWSKAAPITKTTTKVSQPEMVGQTRH